MDQRQRADKWLWHARLVKNRSLATKLVKGGKVRINGNKVLSPGKMVKAGDTLTVNLLTRVIVLLVKDFSERRGSASEAMMNYEKIAPDIILRQSRNNKQKTLMADGISTRKPNKKQRRQLMRLKSDNY